LILYSVIQMTVSYNGSALTELTLHSIRPDMTWWHDNMKKCTAVRLIPCSVRNILPVMRSR